jgi:hypothetical protein
MEVPVYEALSGAIVVSWSVRPRTIAIVAALQDCRGKLRTTDTIMVKA